DLAAKRDGTSAPASLADVVGQGQDDADTLDEVAVVPGEEGSVRCRGRVGVAGAPDDRRQEGHAPVGEPHEVRGQDDVGYVGVALEVVDAADDVQEGRRVDDGLARRGFGAGLEVWQERSAE